MGQDKQIDFPIRNFLGLNTRDDADKIRDNEFTQLQNFYQPKKGTLTKRFGTTSVASGNSIPLANKVTGVWRHYLPTGDKFSIYHCEPSAALLPDNTADLSLNELQDGLGNLFNGGAIVTLRVCYSWIGAGLEQTYNSKNRAGFPAPGAFPVDAWNNPAHLNITFTHSATNSLLVTLPQIPFPAGVRGANIFVARGTETEMVYMGTITTAMGQLVVREFAAPVAAQFDSLAISGVGTFVNGGTLKPGSYYIAGAWVIDSGVQEGVSTGLIFTPLHVPANPVQVLPGQNAINITTGASGGDSTAAQYIFIGTQPATLHPMTCVGVQRINRTSAYIAIPSHNAQSTPLMEKVDSATHPAFYPFVNDGFIGGANYSIGGKQSSRHGFLIGVNSAGTVNEIFPSRSQWFYNFANPLDPFTNNATTVKFSAWFEAPKTLNDTYRGPADGAFTQPYAYNMTIGDPQFCYALGLTYFSNGGDIPWQTDGITLGQLGKVFAVHNTILPPVPAFIFSYQGSLVTAGADENNQIYASNANAPNNWATGGDGTLLRFVSVGDAEGPGVTAIGIFSPQTEATNNPNSYIVAFKKNGTWMIPSIPDPVVSALAGLIGGQSPAPMIQISGRVGCTAPRTIVPTPFGLIFLGQDGNVYMINSVSEPRKIGSRIQPSLIHLIASDSWMKLCTAVYHDNHYKLSFPSPSATLLGTVLSDSQLWLDLKVEEGDPKIWVGPHLGIGIGAQTVFVGEADNFSRIGVNTGTGWVVQLDDTSTLTDLGQKVAGVIKSKVHRFGMESHAKRYMGAFLDCFLDYSYTNNLLLEGFADSFYQAVNRNLSNGGALWDVSQWDGSTYSDAAWMGLSMLFGQPNLIGRTFQWRLTHSDAAPFTLASNTLTMIPERRRVVA